MINRPLTIRPLTIVIAVCLIVTGCGTDAPGVGPSPIVVAPPAPPLAECERNNTGTLKIRNGGFGRNYTVNVGFNGLAIATLKPNEAVTQTVTAGVAYPLRVTLTNSSPPHVLWSGQSPIINRCATQGVVYGG